VVILFLGLLWWRLGMPGWPKKATPAAGAASTSEAAPATEPATDPEASA
jgi:hypothetical protein